MDADEVDRSLTRSAAAPVVAVVRRVGTSVDAVRWAAGYADSLGAPLVVCRSGAVTDAAADVDARVRDALASYRIAVTTIDCGDTCDFGSLVPDAAMVVVDGDDLDGDVVHRIVDVVAAASAWRVVCPITVVRGLPAADELPLAGAVLVGVDSCVRTEPAIAHAFEEASRRGVELIATHSWVDTEPDPLVGGTTECCGTPMGESITLAQGMAGWQELYPDVPVYRHCAHTDPVDAIITGSERGQLIVVGAPSAEAVGTDMSVIYGLVDRARRPVTIVPGPR